MHRHLTSSPIGRKRVWVALPRAPLVSDPRRWVDRHRCRCLDIHWSLHRRSASTLDRDIVVEAAASSRHRTGPCRGHTLSCAVCGPSAAPCASWPVPAYRNFARAWPPPGGVHASGRPGHARRPRARPAPHFAPFPSLFSSPVSSPCNAIFASPDPTAQTLCWCGGPTLRGAASQVGVPKRARANLGCRSPEPVEVEDLVRPFVPSSRPDSVWPLITAGESACATKT